MKNKNILEQQQPKITWDTTTQPKITKPTGVSPKKAILPIPKEEVVRFQDFVSKTDAAALGKYGVDGKWGPLTKAAWTKYGTDYQKSKEVKPEKKSLETPKSEKRTFFDGNKIKFTDGKLVTFPNGDFAYMKPSSTVKDHNNEAKGTDGQPIGEGNYLFFDDYTWEFYRTDDTKYEDVVDSGKYELPKRTGLAMAEDKTVSEQKILSRVSTTVEKPKTQPSVEPKIETPVLTNKKISNLKQFLSALGIPYDQEGIPLPTVDFPNIYDGVIDGLKKGWQSIYFGYFKKALALLQERGEFTDLQLGELSNKFVDREAYQNFPESVEINQLSNPQNVEDSEWQIRKINEIVGQLPKVFKPAYRWSNLVKGGMESTGLGSKSKYFKTVSFEEIKLESCFNALYGWYDLSKSLTPVSTQDRSIVTEYLQRCNSSCVFTDKVKKPTDAQTTGKQVNFEKAIEIIKLLNGLRGNYAQYRLTLPDMAERCKELKKMEKKVGGDPTVEESINFSLKKSIREELLLIKEGKEKTDKEKKIIQNRLFVITENSSKLKKQTEYNKLFDSIILESKFLTNEGLDDQLISEQIFDLLGRIGLGGIADTLQEKFAEWVLTKLNVKKESYLGNLLIVSFGNLDLTNISRILSGDCSSLTKLIAKSAIEALIRKKTTAKDGGEGGYFEGILRNAVDEFLTNDKEGLITTLEDKLTSFICPSLSKVVSNFSGVAGMLKSRLVAN